jgi:hypothetical protein
VSESGLALAREVLIHGPIGRAQLGERLGLSPASLTRLSRPFLQRGIFVEVDEPPASVGRPSKPFDIKPGIGCFYGVKVTDRSVHLVVTDLRANLLFQRLHVLTATEPGAVADLIARLIAEAPRPSGGEPAELSGVGVCLGAKVTGGRRVERAPFLGWRGVSLADLVTAATGLPTVVENDVVALTEGVHWFGPVRDIGDFSVITIGAGVGWGLVVHDQVVNSPDTGLGLGGTSRWALHGWPAPSVTEAAPTSCWRSPASPNGCSLNWADP